MGRFEIEGTTLLSWTLRVEARSESEALEEAQRAASWIDLPSSPVTVSGAQHRIALCRVADPLGRGKEA
jgi:hypothetical protein